MADQPVERPDPPGGLQEAGRATWAAIWRELADSLTLDERERLILAEACHAADALAALDSMLSSLPDDAVMAKIKVMTEQRQQRLTYGRLLAQIDLGESSGAVSPTKRRAQKAAQVRWAEHNRRKAEGG
jgi:hypothetical protein